MMFGDGNLDAYLQSGSRDTASFLDHVDQRVAAGISYSASANLQLVIRYVGDFNTTLHIHLAQLSVGWRFH